jgi:hypothetical protein
VYSIVLGVRAIALYHFVLRSLTMHVTIKYCVS